VGRDLKKKKGKRRRWKNTTISATRHFRGEKNKETTRFGKAATRSSLWDPVPPQNLRQLGNSRSLKALGGGEWSWPTAWRPAGATPGKGELQAPVRVQLAPCAPGRPRQAPQTPGKGAGREKLGTVNTGWWQKGPILARPGVLADLPTERIWRLLPTPTHKLQVPGALTPTLAPRGLSGNYIYPDLSFTVAACPSDFWGRPVSFADPHTSFKVWRSREHNRRHGLWQRVSRPHRPTTWRRPVHRPLVLGAAGGRCPHPGPCAHCASQAGRASGRPVAETRLGGG
jgi:hypothetical protein